MILIILYLAILVSATNADGLNKSKSDPINEKYTFEKFRKVYVRGELPVRWF